MDAYCAQFRLTKDGQTVLEGYSEHVWIDKKAKWYDGEPVDMLHFSLDSMDRSVGEICQIVANLEGVFEWDGWLDAYVPLKNVSLIVFEH